MSKYSLTKPRLRLLIKYTINIRFRSAGTWGGWVKIFCFMGGKIHYEYRVCQASIIEPRIGGLGDRVF